MRGASVEAGTGPRQCCEMCAEPTTVGVVLKVGPLDWDGAVVDMAHAGCHGRALREMHERHRAAHPLPSALHQVAQ